MLVSLIIPTRDRSVRLRASLDHVRRLDMPADRWELILVDNGSRDDTPEVIREFQASAGFRVISVREPGRGSGRAKNAALTRATGRLCVFTDDDCYVGEDFLREMLRAFETDDIGYLGGRVLLHDPKDAALTIQKALEPQVIEPRSFVPMGLIHGANLAALRTTLDAVGGFDPLFGAGARFSGDDVDFVARASWAGFKGKYDPGPLVWHHHGRKPGADARARLKQYDRGRGAYYMKCMLSSGPARALYGRRWYWAVRSRLRDGNVAVSAREIGGALRYLLSRGRKRFSTRQPSY